MVEVTLDTLNSPGHYVLRVQDWPNGAVQWRVAYGWSSSRSVSVEVATQGLLKLYRGMARWDPKVWPLSAFFARGLASLAYLPPLEQEVLASDLAALVMAVPEQSQKTLGFGVRLDYLLWGQKKEALAASLHRWDRAHASLLQSGETRG